MEIDIIRKSIEDLRPHERSSALNTMIDVIIEECIKLREELRCINAVPVSEIDPFPGHPFWVLDDEDMESLACSIERYGQLTPGIVRKKKDGRYEVLSGNRRLYACRLANVQTFRCEVMELTDEEAVIFMIEANRQRIQLHPSEKGAAYSMKQGILERDPLCKEDFIEDRLQRLSLDDKPERIRSMIRLSELTPELREMVDDGKIKLRPAYEISFLSETLQEALLDSIESEVCTPSHSQARRMRIMSEEGTLTQEIIWRIADDRFESHLSRCSFLPIILLQHAI